MKLLRSKTMEKFGLASMKDMKITLLLWSVPFRLAQLPFVWSFPHNWAQSGSLISIEYCRFRTLRIVFILSVILTKMLMICRIGQFLHEDNDAYKTSNAWFMDLFHCTLWVLLFIFTS